MGKFVESPLDFMKPPAGRKGPGGTSYNGEDVEGAPGRTKSPNSVDEVTLDHNKTGVKPGDLSSVKYDKKTSDD